jgi:hypothetical protein
MRQTLSIALFTLLLTACNYEGKDSPDKSNGRSYTVPDDAAITKAVHDAYSCICFKNSNPAYDSIKNYFIPEAQLINFRTGSAVVTSLPQFVDLYKQFLQTSKVTLFYEEEIAGRTEQFGNIAHRISSYKTFLNQMDSASERGVNSFQLIKTPKGWKVSSIIWDVEKPELPIPAYYLKQDSSQRN